MINLTLPQKLTIGDRVMYSINYTSLKCHVTGKVFKHVDVTKLIGTVITFVAWQYIAEVKFDDVSTLPIPLQRHTTWWVTSYKLDTV